MKAPIQLFSILLLLVCYSLPVAAQKSGSVSIRGAVMGMKENDSLRLCVWDGGLEGKFGHYLSPDHIYITAINNQSFQFIIPSLKEASYFTLTLDKNAPKKNQLIFSNLKGLGMYSIVEPNDDVLFTMLIDSITFRVGYGTGWRTDHFIKNFTATGKGSEKYNCIYNVEKAGLIIDSIFSKRSWPGNKELIPQSTDVISPFIGLLVLGADSALSVQLKYLETWKSKIDVSMWEIVRANAIGFSNYSLLRAYMGIAPENTALNKNSRSYLDSVLARKEKDYSVPDTVAVKAIYYTNSLSENIRKKMFREGGHVYKYIKKTYADRSMLRDKLMADYLVHFGKTRDKSDSLIADALQVMVPGYLRDYVRGMSKTLQRGLKGYNFALTDRNGKIVRFSDLQGKVVFIDFWYTGCGGCAQYYKSTIQKVENKFADDPRVLFVTISIDTDINRWINEGLKPGNYTSESANVINLYTNGFGSAAEVIKHYNIFSYPSPMLFDRFGRIFSASWDDLRLNGVDGLVEQISQALKI